MATGVFKYSRQKQESEGNPKKSEETHFCGTRFVQPY